jgi:tricorn protease
LSEIGLAPDMEVQQEPASQGGAAAGGAAAVRGAAAKKPEPVRIDFDGIDQRVLALPIPARNYAGMREGKTGTLFILEAPPGADAQGFILHRFELSKRRVEKVTEGVTSFDVSANGEKMLLQIGGGGGGAQGGAQGGGTQLGGDTETREPMGERRDEGDGAGERSGGGNG